MPLFDPEDDECLRKLMRPAAPRRRLQMARGLLESTAPLSAKILALRLDECASHGLVVARRDALRRGAMLTDKQMRSATAALTSGGWVEQTVGGRGRATRWALRKRREAVWVPHWVLAWMSSTLVPSYATQRDVQALVCLHALAIWRSAGTVEHARVAGPWCDTPVDELARVMRRDVHDLAALLRMYADSGLGVVVHRPAPYPPVIIPTVYPLGLQSRFELADCLVGMLAAAYPQATDAEHLLNLWEQLQSTEDWAGLLPQLDEAGLWGLLAPTLYDDPRLIEFAMTPTAAPPADVEIAV